LAPHLAVAFGAPGLLGLDRLTALDVRQRRIDSQCTAPGFIQLALEVADQGRTWLDMACGQLDVSIHDWFHHGPLVIVAGSAADLALGWSLRITTDHDTPPWRITIPAECLAEPDTISVLREWGRAARPYQFTNSDFGIASLTVGEPELAKFAERVGPAVETMPVRVLSGRELLERLPVTIPTERSRVYSLVVSDQTLSWQLPHPESFDEDRHGAWMIDFLQDRRTGRAPFELALPARRPVLEILNTGGPTPHTTFGWMDRYGLSHDGLTAHTSANSQVVHQWLPTPDELLPALLEDGGIEPRTDELRGLYRSAIQLFGDVTAAASACVGPARSVLRHLEEGPKTLDRLMCQTRLGQRELAELARPDFDWYFRTRNPSALQQRIWTERFQAAANARYPAQATLPGLLERWGTIGVVHRTWELPQCTVCRQTRWTDALDVRQPVPCPVCGTSLHLPKRLELGYGLNPLVRQALGRGFAPVILTARFLDRMTRRGFIWLPSQKICRRGAEGEIDVLACGDGRLVLCECKELADAGPTSPSWPGVWSQFEALAGVAAACRANLLVLATLAERLPDGWTERAAALAAGQFRVLLLTRSDLEAGTRRIRHTFPEEPEDPDGHTVPLSFDDLFPDE
jgi:hypothetical protein